MIAKLAGVIDQIGPEAAIIDVGGVGYLAFCSTRTISRLPVVGAPASLLIETHVREDHIHLYGFLDASERDWFRQLTTVQGVGARLAARIVNELHDKVGGAAAAAVVAIPTAPDADPGSAADAVSALVNLGYGRTEAFSAVAAAARRLGRSADAGALIRAGLQELAR